MRETNMKRIDVSYEHAVVVPGNRGDGARAGMTNMSTISSTAHPYNLPSHLRAICICVRQGRASVFANKTRPALSVEMADQHCASTVLVILQVTPSGLPTKW